MKAARLHQYKRPLQLVEVDLPKPKGEYIVTAVNKITGNQGVEAVLDIVSLTETLETGSNTRRQDCGCCDSKRYSGCL